MSAAFFDLDGTLWAVSVEKTFAGHLAHLGVLKKRQLGAVLWKYIRYELGMFSDHDAFKTAAIRELFTQVDSAQIELLYQDYFDKNLKNLFYPAMIQCVNNHKLAGDKIIVISASLAFMVRPAANYIGADASFGTELSINSGRYTGSVYGRIHYAEKKALTVEDCAQQYKLDLSLCYAYGDRFEDRYMLGSVGHPVAINPSRKFSRFAKLNKWTISRIKNN